MKLRWPLAVGFFSLCMSFGVPMPSLAAPNGQSCHGNRKTENGSMEREAQKKRHEMERQAQKTNMQRSGRAQNKRKKW